MKKQRPPGILRKTESFDPSSDERIYQLAMQSAADGLWDWRIPDDRVYFNPQWFSMLGYSPDELSTSHETFRSLVHPDDLGHVDADIQRTMSGEPGHEHYQVEFRMRAKDGAWHWILSRGQITEHDAAGKPSRFTGTHTDITELKQATDRLREEEELFTRVFQMSPDAFTISRVKDGIYLAVNQGFTTITGYSAEDVIGRSVSEIGLWANPADRGRGLELLQAHGNAEIDADFRIKDGSLVRGRIAARLIEFKGETCMLSITRDITEQVKVEKDLRESENRYRQLFEAESDTIVLIDNQNGRILEANSAAAQMYGYSREELLAMRNSDLSAEPEQTQQVTTTTPIQPQTVVRIPLRYHRRKDGTVFPVEITGRFFIWQGRPVHVAAIRDITERMRAETALKRSEALLRTLVEANPDTAVLVSVKGAIQMINESGAKRLGGGVNELVGKNLFDCMPPAMAETYKKQVATLQQTQKLIRLEEERDGRYYVILYRPVLDENGEVEAVAVLTQEVTEQRLAAKSVQRINEELEERVRERTAQLEAAVKELESFSYSVSHDLRAPLRAINGFGQALEEDYGSTLNEEALGYLSRIRQASTRMGELIDNLLKLSRVTRSEVHPMPIDLSDMAGEISRELLAAHPGREVTFDIQPGLTAEGDPLLLRVVLDNLLANAFKFTGKHAAARIAFGCKQQAGETVYFVSDDGAGFDMAYVDKLFGTFQRLHGMTDFEGSGIGLATVQRIIRRHGGRVWAEGAVEQGARFFFTLGHASRSGTGTPPSLQR